MTALRAILALALVGFLAACAGAQTPPSASMPNPDKITGHFGAGMTADRTAGR